MLRQEINLYRYFETPHTSADLLTWKRYWLSNLAVFILLIIIYFFSSIEYIYMEHQIKNLQADLVNYQTQFLKMKSTMPQLFFDKDVNDAVKNMKSELAAQQQIIEILSRNTPFSQILTEISHSIVPDAWLTSIEIQKSGAEITLKGNTIGTNVDEFLDKIGKNTLLSNYKIELNEVKNKNPDDENIKLGFEILMVKKAHE